MNPAKLRPAFSVVLGFWWASHYAAVWSDRFMLLAFLLGILALTGMHVLMFVWEIVSRKESKVHTKYE